VGKTKSEAGDADEGASLAKKRGGSGAQPEVTSITTARAAPSTPSQTPMKLPQTLADRRGISIANTGAARPADARDDVMSGHASSTVPDGAAVALADQPGGEAPPPAETPSRRPSRRGRLQVRADDHFKQ
jgi:hypothetical protein